jgi:hypothetical protein
MTTVAKMYESARKELNAQIEWMTSKGGDLAGYRAHYGSYPGLDPDAIFRSDQATLAQRQGDFDHFARKLVR